MSASSKPDLSIIVLSFNSQFWLKKTLETLHHFYIKKTSRQIEVIVVDNHSQDESVSMVKKNFQWAKCIELAENIGFSAGNNVGLKEATGKHVMLLNSDVEFDDHSNLDILVDYLEENPSVGAITPRLELVNGQVDLASHRGEPTLWAAVTYFAGLEKIFPNSPTFAQYHQLYKNLETSHQIDACSGAAMIVKSSVIKKVGLLDEIFFFYAEDLDWCKRIREAGFTIYYEARVKLIHHKYKSGMQSSSQAIQRKTSHYFYDTMLQYYDKHYQTAYPKFVRTIIKYFLNLKKGAL
jgi:GT2 family glycosyltransferase